MFFAKIKIYTVTVRVLFIKLVLLETQASCK